MLEPDPPPPPTKDEVDAEAARTYQKLAALRNMTPAQAGAWIDQNVTNLAEAKDVLRTLAIFACVVARRL